LRLGELSATQLCQYNSLVQVVNAALGGGSKSGPSPEPEGQFQASGDIEKDVAALNNMLRF
jgi:hypothetical protein